MSKVNHIVAKIWRYFLILIAAIVISCIPIPLLLGLVVPSFILRTFVKIIARLFRPDLAEIFRGKGIIFAFESIYTRPKLSILLHFVVDGNLSIDKVRLLFQQRIINHTDKNGNLPYVHLRQRWTQFLGFLFWQWDKNFSLNNHIRMYDHTEPELALPEVCTEEDLKRVTAGLISEPYREGQSPWEVLVIPKYRSANNETGKEQMVMVVRIHHAMADGYSILKMLLKLFNLEGAKVPRPNFPKVPVCKRIVRALVMPFRLPFDIASQFVVDCVDGTNAWHLVGHKLSRQYETFFSDQVPVEKIKEIKNKHGVGYNAAVYAVATGGIRRLMIEAGQKVPKKMSCFVPFPLPNHPGGLVVHVAGFSFNFSPRIHSPVERLHQISNNFHVLQDAPAVPIVLSIAVECLAVMPIWILKLIYNKMMITMAMTSFPGPEEQLNLVGSTKLTDIIPAMGHMPGNLGVVAVLVSLAGKQRVVLTVDKEIFKSHKTPTNFAKHINDEIEALLHTYAENTIQEV